MADATFAQIEAALVARIKDQITYLEDRNVAAYAGQIEDASNGLPVEAPAAFVAAAHLGHVQVRMRLDGGGNRRQGERVSMERRRHGRGA